jgi:uncharacterized membrane protein
MTAPAAVSWAARLGWLPLQGTRLAFLGHPVTPYVLTALAVGELIADQLPGAPSRKAPGGFSTRIVTGALSGAAIGEANNALVVGLVSGMLGAVAGTLVGYEGRVRAAKAVGKDLPVALAEDLLAISAAAAIVTR